MKHLVVVFTNSSVFRKNGGNCSSFLALFQQRNQANCCSFTCVKNKVEQHLTSMEKYTNALIHESSLYLQQHAHNPVNWLPWSKDAFEQAKRENKLVLVSIGYSSCHWCHVMEHECFEDEEVATLMNKFFVCLKVDREERPDVDQVYMTAVQLMTQRGGWPLNCFTLPDGRPIYGGTYFPKEQWMHILKSLHTTFAEQPEKVAEYAEDLTHGVAQSDLISEKTMVSSFPKEKLWELVKRWKPRMDMVEGGSSHAPKFPLPSNIEFLGFYGQKKSDETIQHYVDLWLHKMAFGGIYDQVGGGFSRYSVDLLWKIPHFEKMLYDNGQLLQVYAQAYHRTKHPEYKRVLEGTLRWLEREILSDEGALFAAQDADSEGVEGKFYVWKKEALQRILGADFDWFWPLFNPENKGYWEHENYVLLRNISYEDAAKQRPSLTPEKIQGIIDTLYFERKKRIPPVTDTKSLTAWNAMAVSGLVEAYKSLNDTAFLTLAQKIGRWIRGFQVQDSGALWHTRQNGVSFTSGFMDDYAFTIKAAIDLYQVKGEKDWLEFALSLTNYANRHFYDHQSGMYFFTSNESELIARKMEINDNVVPSTNSVMANNLLSLFYLTDDFDFESKAKQLLANVMDGMEQYGSGYSNWALCLLRFEEGVQVIHVPTLKKEEVNFSVISPFVLLKFTEDKEFSVCSNGSCSRGVETWQEMVGMLERC